MKRRKFLLASGSAVLSGTALSGLQRPVFGLEFELLTIPSTDASNIDSVLIDFGDFRLKPQYVDSSKDATISIEVVIGSYSNSISKSVSVTNGQPVTASDLKSKIPILLDSINTTKSSIDGEITIMVDHSSIGVEKYNQTFTVTDNPLLNGLVAYYPMEKGAGRVLHDSSDDNDGEIIGASWSEASKTGSHCLRFDGDNDEVKIDNAFSVTDNNDFTITSWAKLESKNKDGVIIAGESDSNPDNDTWWKIQYDNTSSDAWEMQFDDDNSKKVITDSESPQIGDWYFIVLTHSEGDEYELFVDSEPAGTAPDNGSTYESTHDTFIGHRPPNDNYIDGYVDDVRIYNRVLSNTEIQDLYNLSEPSGYEVTESFVQSNNDGGISRYKFDGDVTDSWGSNNGTSHGVSYSPGVYVQSAKFDGSNYIDVPFNMTDYNPLTVSAWVKPTDTSTRNAILEGNDGTNEAIFRTDTQERLAFFTYDGSPYGVTKTGTVPTDKWSHVVGTYDGLSGYKVYINGSKEDEDTDTTFIKPSINQDIGRRAGSNDRYFNGKIDDLRIYNEALSEKEVNQLFSLGSYRI